MEAVDGALVIRLMMVLLMMFFIMRVIGVLDVVSGGVRRLVIGHEPLEGCLVVPDRSLKVERFVVYGPDGVMERRGAGTDIDGRVCRGRRRRLMAPAPTSTSPIGAGRAHQRWR